MIQMSQLLTQHRHMAQRWIDRLSRLSLSRSVAIFLAIAAIISCAATYIALTKGAKSVDTIYALLNLDLVLLLSFGAVIARQLVRLWSERKRGVAGSRLHARLVFLFGILTAVPAIMMAIFSAFFLYYGMQAWFNERVSTAVHESLEVAQSYLREHQQVMRADVLAMENDLNREAASLSDNRNLFSQVIETQSSLRNLPEAIVLRSNGEIIARSRYSFSLTLDRVTPDMFEKANKEDILLMTGNAGDRIRALVKLDNFFDSYLYVGRMVDANVLQHMETAEKAVAEYTSLDGKRSQLQISTTLMFVALAVLLLFAAVWVGFNFAERLASPISALIEAAEKVTAGNLTARVTEDRYDDELGLLGGAFNRMTTQLQAQQQELLSANRMLEERQRFTEAVLSGASSGIVGMGRNGVIHLANLKAMELLSGEDHTIEGKKLSDFLPQIEESLKILFNAGEKPPAFQCEYQIANTPRKTLFVRMIEEKGGSGAVVTIDDITLLASAQRSAAWSDVARRIAHEIKNPLTPIQLSAERLKRKYLGQISEDSDTFSKLVETIIRQVQDIGHLVNEFSAYARMPIAIKKKENMVAIVQDAFILQKQAYPDISFVFNCVEKELVLSCDRAQITQVIINLLQNAIDSIHEKQAQSDNRGKIEMTLRDSGSSVSLDITDNGMGLPEKIKDQLLEPYVTTKKKGSGLGLPIVKKIVEDHGGSVLIENNMQEEGQTGAHVALVFPKEV